MSVLRLVIAIKFRDPGRFRQSRIPGLATSQSWDFGIAKNL